LIVSSTSSVIPLCAIGDDPSTTKRGLSGGTAEEFGCVIGSGVIFWFFWSPRPYCGIGIILIGEIIGVGGAIEKCDVEDGRNTAIGCVKSQVKQGCKICNFVRIEI